MRPEEMLARRLASEADAELDGLRALAQEFAAAPSGKDTFALRARASILHDLYTGAERIFVRLAEELNGGVPRGENWHRQLLDDMALDLPEVRPPVISAELAATLGQFLRFRHVFRNNYGFVLDAARMKPLEEQFGQVLDQLAADVRAFSGWMLGQTPG
ncbi:MAG: hypothetical protein ABIL09_14765 [Gemmatimonadota bacterium]